MQAMGLSDELAMVRTRIAGLKAREAALCKALGEADALARVGRWTQAQVVERRLHLFDHRLLPLEVQADPTYWVERVQKEVSCRLRDGVPAPEGLRRIEIGAPVLGAADAAVIGQTMWM